MLEVPHSVHGVFRPTFAWTCRLADHKWVLSSRWMCSAQAVRAGKFYITQCGTLNQHTSRRWQDLVDLWRWWQTALLAVHAVAQDKGLGLRALATLFAVQIDVNPYSEEGWKFCEASLVSLCKNGGAKMIRLDAFGYVTKKPGTDCFMEVPYQWCSATSCKLSAADTAALSQMACRTDTCR